MAVTIHAVPNLQICNHHNYSYLLRVSSLLNISVLLRDLKTTFLAQYQTHAKYFRFLKLEPFYHAEYFVGVAASLPLTSFGTFQ